MDKSPNSLLSRRRVFAGAGAVGALAAVVAVLPSAPDVPHAALDAKPAPEGGGGYRVSEHVLRYYQTAKV